MDGVWGASPPPPEKDEAVAAAEKAAKAAAKAAVSSSSSSGSDSSSSSSTDSEDERRQRKKAQRKRKRKAAAKSEKSKRSKSSSSKSKSKSKKKKKYASSSSSSSSSNSSSDSEDDAPAQQWVVDPAAAQADPTAGAGEAGALAAVVEDDDEDVGPAVPEAAVTFNAKNDDFGGALLAGEGDAMAAFVAEGKRIPRRGEIGLLPEQIESFESDGWVMSGSRHRRMEAVRIRKENQIYSADERRALAMFHWEEKQKKEAKINQDFKALLANNFTKSSGPAEGDSKFGK
jgi:DNA mismatch repair ATPase MutL